VHPNPSFPLDDLRWPRIKALRRHGRYGGRADDSTYIGDQGESARTGTSHYRGCIVSSTLRLHGERISFIMLFPFWLSNGKSCRTMNLAFKTTIQTYFFALSNEQRSRLRENYVKISPRICQGLGKISSLVSNHTFRAPS